MSRSYEQISALPAGITPLTGAELCELEQDGVSRKFPMSAMAGITAAHEAHHQRDGSDPIGSDEVEAYAIPYLDASGRIDSRVSDASTTVKGKVQLATSGEEDASKAVNGLDERLSDSRYPTEHAASHVGGADPIPQATTSNDGLMTSTHVQTLTDLASVDLDNLPTAGEKAALAGSYGTPGAGNKYVTEDDPIIASIEGIPVGVPIPVCDDAPALESPFEPMNGQLISDAESVFNGRRLRNLNGASVLLDLTFTADAGGAYAEIDEADLPAVGLHDWVIGTGVADNTWISDIGLPLPVATSQANIIRTSIELHETDIYAGSSGDVYKMDEYGVFQPTSQTESGLKYLKSFDGELYATKDTPSGDVYKMDGSGVFQATSQTLAYYDRLFIHNNELCVVVQSVGIYKMDGSGVFQPYLSISDITTAESFNGLIIYRLTVGGPLYAHDGTKSFRYTVDDALLGNLGVIDNRLFVFYTGVFEVVNGRIVPIIEQDSTYDALLVDDTLYILAREGSAYDLYTIDYSKRLLTISDPAATGAISCTITNEGRGIIGGAFGSVGDQGQRLTGTTYQMVNGGWRAGGYEDGVFTEDDYNPSIAGIGSGSSYGRLNLNFNSANSPYARTSADTWGKTKTDAYKLTYYMRIK